MNNSHKGASSSFRLKGKERTRSRPGNHLLKGVFPLIFFPAGCIYFTFSHWPGWAFMWLLAFAIFAGCKWLTWRRSNLEDSKNISAWRHVGYLFAWPGLDAKAFLCSSASPQKPAASEYWFAITKLSFGIAMLFFVPRLFDLENKYWVGWIGMIGIVMILHFGLFHLISCAWRSNGVDARPLMEWPILSTSLSEFWGRRWNTAFRDLTHQFLFRPLANRVGILGALMVGFVGSGLIHDIVISLPAGGGYGRPTLFFMLQGLGIVLERSSAGRRLGLRSGWLGWLFALAMLLVPAPLLFHGYFIENVMVPFMQAIGAV